VKVLVSDDTKRRQSLERPTRPSRTHTLDFHRFAEMKFVRISGPSHPASRRNVCVVVQSASRSFLPNPSASGFHQAVYERKMARLARADLRKTPCEAHVSVPLQPASQPVTPPAAFATLPHHIFLPNPSASPFHAAVYERKAERIMRALAKEFRDVLTKDEFHASEQQPTATPAMWKQLERRGCSQDRVVL